MIRGVFLALAIALTSCSAKSEADLLASVGIVDFGEQRDEEFTFGLSRIDQRFRFDSDDAANFDALFNALQASNETGRSLRVVYDGSSGSFESGSTLPSYDVSSIEYDGAIFTVRPSSRRRDDRRNAAESSLALGLAYYSSDALSKAVPALESALAAAELKPQLEALALKTHGNAIMDSIWEQHEVADDADDRQLVRALEEFRRWSNLEPRNHEAQLAIGLALRDLGAYDEAIETFRQLIAVWPEQRTRMFTRIAATQRIMGDYPRALATLDELTAGEEPPFGMMYHYHRGWILNLMGRYEEALRELNEGLKTQPDYSSAFDRRACAHAQLGRLEEALSDRRRADELDAAFFKDPRKTPGVEHNLARARSINATLEAAIAAGSKEPNAAPCADFWRHGEVKRTRSQYLPAKAGRGPVAVDAQGIGMRKA